MRLLRLTLVLSIAALVCPPRLSFAADIPDEAREGARQYKKQDYPQATESFRQAVIAAPDDDRWRYGLGLSQAQSGDFESAQTSFESVSHAEDTDVAADALYNAGNVSLATQDFAGAVNNFRRSLLKRPGDPDALRNMEIALEQLTRMQQQEQQQQQNQDGEPSDSTGQQDQEQKNDKQDKDSQNQSDSTQQQQQPQQDSTGQSQNDSLQQEPHPDSTMSREQAERILKALGDEEAKLREKATQIIAAPAPGGKDW